MTGLAIPLGTPQIRAALQLRKWLKQWISTDRALNTLKDKLPGFDSESCLIKTATINSLYGTNVWAVNRMAERVYSTIAKRGLVYPAIDLVEEIAALPAVESQEVKRRHTSFASKFTHFFIDEGCFVIYDYFAVTMVNLHLGRKNRPETETKQIRDERPYKTFYDRFALLKKLAKISRSNRELDHYLWLAGQYRQWNINKKKGKKSTASLELINLFQHPPPEARSRLTALLPTELWKGFRGR